MDSLYIVGNGFDLHHGLNTRYSSFGLYLQEHYGTTYDQLLEYFGLPHISKYDENIDPLWSDFEHSLSLLDVDMVFDAHSDSLANPGSPDFRDRDWNTFAIDMEMVVGSLTTNLIKAFREFISKINYSMIPSRKRLSLNAHALYLSFNYTDTLEGYYGISKNQITYIHGKAVNDDEIILGHGIDPDNFKKEPPKSPAGVSDEEIELWEEQMNDQYDYSQELGKDALQEYFSSSFKDTQAVINEHVEFFDSIKDIGQVFILGHSLSDVDLTYFEKVISSITITPAFTVSYFGDDERVSHTEALCRLGVQERKISMINIEEMV